MFSLSRHKTVKIRTTRKDLIIPQQMEYGDMIDLRAAENVFIPEGEDRLISLGVAMQLPKGYYAEVVPRSSLFKNFGLILVNSVGIIDETYCGNDDIWRFHAYCLKGRDFQNNKKGTRVSINDRLCQFRIVKKQPRISFEVVKKLTGENRGGIGSTGVK